MELNETLVNLIILFITKVIRLKCSLNKYWDRKQIDAIITFKLLNIIKIFHIDIVPSVIPATPRVNFTLSQYRRSQRQKHHGQLHTEVRMRPEKNEVIYCVNELL